MYSVPDNETIRDLLVPNSKKYVLTSFVFDGAHSTATTLRLSVDFRWGKKAMERAKWPDCRKSLFPLLCLPALYSPSCDFRKEAPQVREKYVDTQMCSPRILAPPMRIQSKMCQTQHYADFVACLLHLNSLNCSRFLDRRWCFWSPPRRKSAPSNGTMISLTGNTKNC